MEKIISQDRRTQQIFVAHCIWWLASVIGLKQGSVSHFNNLHKSYELPFEKELRITAVSVVHQDIRKWSRDEGPSDSVDNITSNKQTGLLKKSKKILISSRRLWRIAALKASGTTKTGCIKLWKAATDSVRVPTLPNCENYSKMEGICETEIQWRKSMGDCLLCAWPSDRKGNHRVEDRILPINLHNGTATHPKCKEQYTVANALLSASPDNKESKNESDSETYDVWPYAPIHYTRYLKQSILVWCCYHHNISKRNWWDRVVLAWGV